MHQEPSPSDQSSDRKLLSTGLTLISLGLSILFLNSWDNSFVKVSVGLFWIVFILVVNGPDALRTFRSLAKKNDNRRRSLELTNQ